MKLQFVKINFRRTNKIMQSKIYLKADFTRSFIDGKQAEGEIRKVYIFKPLFHALWISFSAYSPISKGRALR